MNYPDFMQKYRPLYAPDDGSAASADGASAAAATPAAAPSTDAASAASPATTATSSSAPAADGAGAAAAPDSAATLLEAASSAKPDAKPEGDGAAKPADDASAVKKDDPAPAADAKTDKDAKPEGDKKPEGEADKKDGTEADPEKKDATAEAPPAPISYVAFKLPDGINLDDKKLQAFTDIVGAKQLPQEDAQKLIDLYVAEKQADAALARAEQRKVWDTLNDTWKTELRNDTELGGNRLETTLSLAKAVVEEYLTPAEQAEYMAHMRNNGMGNFKLHVKLLHNIGKAMNVFEDGIVPANPQAPKAQKGPGQRGWYDKSLNAPQ